MRPSKTKSRTFRRLNVRLAKRTTTQYVKPKHSQAHCGSCGKILHGIPRGIPSQVAKLAKTERRPQRPYGGVLCSPCSRRLIIEKSMASSS